MNTANLQIEGVLAAMTALISALQRKGLLSEAEIEAVLAEAEEGVVSDPDRPPQVRPAHVDAACFPLRYLRRANKLLAGNESASFTSIASQVGREKIGHERSVEAEDIEASEDSDVQGRAAKPSE